MYTIAVPKIQFDDLVANASNEYLNEKIKSKKLTGKWVNCFQAAINDNEGNKNCLCGKIARIYDVVKRQDANWFSANSKLLTQKFLFKFINFFILVSCKETRDCEVKYTLSIRNKPVEDEKTFYQASVIRIGEHMHKDLKTQLRGKVLN
jgi:mRNA-degrading endonuclease YafQ of YafQ-DinJ toxin-antitoxin module